MHPESNGHAESGVKNMKRLLQKSANFADFRHNLLYWRNTCRSGHNLSPSQLFFGRNLITQLPHPPAAADTETVQSNYSRFSVGDCTTRVGAWGGGVT